MGQACDHIPVGAGALRGGYPWGSATGTSTLCSASRERDSCPTDHRHGGGDGRSLRPETRVSQPGAHLTPSLQVMDSSLCR